jgi:TonB family protein
MKRTLAVLLLAGGLASPAAAQDNPLNTARELYASARYDEALLVLNGLRPGPGGGGDLKSIEQYRSLCLLALGRGAEAEAAIAAVVSADPLYLPSEAEASPRVRTAFSEVRQRQLPEIARARYAAAKATFDRKHYAQAEQQFRELLRLIDDPDMGGRLGDLRLLVSGFLDLSAAAAAPPPEPAREAAPAAAAPPPPTKPALPPDHVFTAADAGVVAPVAVKQDVPRVPSAITSQTRDRGILELVIDQQGRVTSIDIKVRMHPMFDSQLIQAAKDWRYRPATLDGKPVRYRKLVQVTVTK